LVAALVPLFGSKPAQHWEDLLLAADVGCVVASADPPEVVLQSKEFAGAADLLVEVEHPTFGEHPRMKPLVEMSRSKTLAEPGCLNGQHTDAILTELGYSAEQIADLRERRIVG
jgi:crotonobetainyl-CoA:carnitine CoA-transferase CaiB-like acyl-CoA transferase